jgi:hypothetical protein
VLTRDEERNLSRALDSLPPGMPALVVDAESLDSTQELARAHGATIVVRPWNGFVDSRRFAQTQVHTPWTLALDADEALDDRLRDAILSAGPSCDGYTVARTTYYCGAAMRLWSGERLLRLFRTQAVRVEANPAAGGAAELHERYVVGGTVRELGGMLHHYSYPDAASYGTKYARYTSLEAQGLAPSLARALVATFMSGIRFAWLLLGRGALLDGRRGLVVAWWSALYPAVVAWKALHRR